MNLIKDLQKSLMQALPAIRLSLSQPAHSDGLWYLTVQRAPHPVIVSWLETDNCFGIVSSADGDAAAPHETVTNVDTARARIEELVRSGATTRRHLPALEGIRQAAGLSQTALAHRMGVSQPTLANMERRMKTGDIRLSTLINMLYAAGGDMTVKIGDTVLNVLSVAPESETATHA